MALIPAWSVSKQKIKFWVRRLIWLIWRLVMAVPEAATTSCRPAWWLVMISKLPSNKTT